MCIRDRTDANPPEGGRLQWVGAMAASASRLAIGFLQGVLNVLGQLLSFLDPVVASLNRARYPRETIVFLLVSLFILLAAGLHHHGLTLKLADEEKRREHEIRLEERRHEQLMQKAMLELMHTCSPIGTNVSNVLQAGSTQLRLDGRISSPKEPPAPPAPCAPPPVAPGTCCHLVRAGTSAHTADVVTDVRLCVDQHLATDLVGAVVHEHSRGHARRRF
eukprot:3558159-Prymnesium_polylepis.1